MLTCTHSNVCQLEDTGATDGQAVPFAMNGKLILYGFNVPMAVRGRAGRFSILPFEGLEASGFVCSVTCINLTLFHIEKSLYFVLGFRRNDIEMLELTSYGKVCFVLKRERAMDLELRIVMDGEWSAGRE